MIIRIQSSEGLKRIEVDQNDKLLNLFDKVRSALSLPSTSSFKLFKERGRKNELKSTTTKTLKQSNLKHGDIVYVEELISETRKDVNVGASTSKSNSENDLSIDLSVNGIRRSASTSSLKEDAVDTELRKENGLIHRNLDPAMCKHGTNAKCLNCMPLEPFDESYLKENNIKHLSFHSYLRKQTAGLDQGKFAALDNISCRIKAGCTDHLPWPKGICTKCQPNAVTLSRQQYRHVDNVVFENLSIVEQFLNYWRSTGHQRIGFLYGNYEKHTGIIPLGIKANVLAIYEPPQESSSNFIKLTLPDKNEQQIEEIAAKLGMKRIGWIFTDLISQDSSKGTVKHFRNVNNYFLTAQECIMAGYFQTIYPNICKSSNDGYFGSKFVTVIITGDKENQIHMEGYQVSNQCMALVRDQCLIPTKDAPELAYVKETSKEQYVPDVFFTEKDKFNNEIKQVARLLPIEYLLIDVPVSAPLEQKYTFNSDRSKKPFSIENRAIQGHLQDFTSLSEYLSQFKEENQFLDAVKDFHLLVYLSTMDMISFKNDLDRLLEAIKNNDNQKAIEWSKNENWQTLEQLIVVQKSANARPSSASSNSISPQPNDSSGGSSNSKWSCQHCTFENTSSRTSCEMCSLPQS